MGQVADGVGKPRTDILFTANSGGAQVFLTSNAIHYQFAKTEYPAGYIGDGSDLKDDPQQQSLRRQIKSSTHRFTVSLHGANPHPVIRKEERNSYTENFYLAQCPQGITNVHTYGRVVYEGVYPGIDWVVYGNGQGLKYDFVVHPGADPGQIKLKVSDAESIGITKEGELVMHTSLGEVRESVPESFCNGKKVATQFFLADETIGFSVGAYDKEQKLVIDPNVVWATYYNAEWGTSCVVDNSGNVYMGGFAGATNDVSSGGFQNTYGGNRDAYLVKFNVSGTRVWGTYYGGSSFDEGYGCAVDGSGNIYLAGLTESDSAMASGGFQNTFGGGNNDAFLVKFNSAGVRMWATYYGGSGPDYAKSCAVDGNGNVYIAGHTSSPTGIAFGGHQNTLGGAFLVKFDGAGNRIWGTYYGLGSYGRSCTVDFNGNVYLAGFTQSGPDIASSGFQNTYGGGTQDGFLVKFNSSGVRIWGTYYGGSNLEWAECCAADGSGNVYMAGWTGSDSGIASGSFQNTRNGGDAFLVKFNASGARQWGTYYGNTSIQSGKSCAVDGSGNVYLSGQTSDTSNIASQGTQINYGGGYADAFLAKFDGNGVRQWGTYYGGGNHDDAECCTTDRQGNVYISGFTFSPTGIATGGFQNTIGSYVSAFLAKINGANGVGIDQVVKPQSWPGSFIIYPNPAKDILTLDASWDALQIGKTLRLELINSLGQLVYTTETTPVGTRFSMAIPISAAFANGLYMLRVSAPGIQEVKSVNLQR